ncbi:hypothetical protein LMG7143_04436 [Ralstonia thomasii]|uniref:P-type conjugative transfer protein TrbL n=1 Tax=Ralstonia thomasii TaxID=3058596 RepID=UPI0028F64C53|nr:P-type conjugative transfer protein TrbL [Ralstonia sp. LMG 18095]CAJ0718526.1 hypothetical protein LMG7143_04436 [Ralstonia sp. LMG 18095]
MNMKLAARIAFSLALAFAVLHATDVLAQVSSANILDSVLDKYKQAASGWGTRMTSAATYVFWSLAVISLAWTFGQIAIRGGGMTDLLAETIRFFMTTGLFWWLLSNGAEIGSAIIKAMRQLGSEANGGYDSYSPSGVVDIGFDIFFRILDQSSVWTPVDSMAGILMGAVVLVVLALVGVNMLLLLVTGWFLNYAGLFYLGFGGGKWTSDMAIGFYRTILAIGIELMAMVLLVGIGQSFIDQYYKSLSQGVSLKEIAVVMIAAIVLLVLVNKIPSRLSSIAGVGGGGIGTAGAGAAIGAAGLAGAAGVLGTQMAAAGAANVAGGVTALKAAFDAAQSNMENGTGMFGSGGGGGGGPSAPDANGGASGADSKSGSQAKGGSKGGSKSFAAAMGTPGPALSAVGAGLSADAGEKATDSSGAEAGGDNASADAGPMGDAAATAADASAGEAGSATGDGPSAAGGEGNAPSSGGEAGKGRSTLGARATTAAKFAADMGANLSKGAGAVAKEKGRAIADAAGKRVSETFGGRVASAIRAQQASASTPDDQAQDTNGGNGNDAATFDGDSLAAGKEGHSEEIDAFVNKDNKSASA